MNLDEIKKNIIVIVDSREQKNLHVLSRLSEKGIKFMVSALKYGDYSFYIQGNEEQGIEESIFFWDKVVVERKNSLLEIAGNFCKGRTRFYQEFAKAKNDGCKVTLMIEDEKGRDKIRLRKELDVGLQKVKQHIKEYEKRIKDEPDEFIRQLLEDEKLLIEQKLNIDEEFALRKTWKSRFCANSMIAGIKTFKDRYDLDVIFCKKTESADKMLEIFYKAIDSYLKSDKE